MSESRLQGPLRDSGCLATVAVVGSDEQPVVAAQATQALAAALPACGCLSDTANELATAACVEGRDGFWMLVLLGYGAALPREADETESAVDYLAANVAADNSRANDRAARGETGRRPLWPLPDRRPRHRNAP